MAQPRRAIYWSLPRVPIEFGRRRARVLSRILEDAPRCAKPSTHPYAGGSNYGGRGDGWIIPCFSSTVGYQRGDGNNADSHAKSNRLRKPQGASLGKRSQACREVQHACAIPKFAKHERARRVVLQWSYCPSSECSPYCGNAVPVLASPS